MRVGFIGLGDQGEHMAYAILEGGHELHVWARRPEVLEPYAAVGAVIHESAASVAAAVEYLGLCVVSAADVREVLLDGAALEACQPGAIIAIHSTISAADCIELDELAGKRGVHVIDAPVSGGRAGSVDRTLLVLVGGDTDAVERAMPIMRTFGSTVRHLGPVGMGQRAKILNNLVMNLNLIMANLGLEWGSRLGFERSALRDLLLRGSARSFALEGLDKAPVGPNGPKDMQLARDLAAEMGAPLAELDEILSIAIPVRKRMLKK